MPKEGSNAFYRAYADRWYLDRANRDTYLARQAAGDILLSGNLALAALKTLDGVDLSVHAADLDAHMSDIYQTLVTGEYFAPYPIQTSVTAAFSANILHAMPCFVARPMTVDRIACDVTAQAGEKIRMGIYNDGTNLYPGTLLLDAGEITLSATGMQVIVINQALTRGLYWLVILSNGAPTMRIWYPAFSPLGISSTSFLLTTGCLGFWWVAFTYNALPTPFTAGAAISTNPYAIALRLKSLD